MLCALQCLTVRKRFIRCASNFACNVHIDTRWCTRFFNVLGPFLDTERDYLLDGLRIYGIQSEFEQKKYRFCWIRNESTFFIILYVKSLRWDVGGMLPEPWLHTSVELAWVLQSLKRQPKNWKLQQSQLRAGFGRHHAPKNKAQSGWPLQLLVAPVSDHLLW